MTSDLVNIRSSAKAAEPHSKPGVYIKTYGCQMNEYDSQKLLKLVEDRYVQVNSPDQAELIMVNTCSVRDKPEKKLYSQLGEFRPLKEANPKIMIGVGGCVAQQEGESILKRSDLVDFVFGTHNLSLVPSLIDRRREGLGRQVAVNYRDEWEDLPVGFSGDGRICVYVSISRGCNKNCSYCIVPTTRGPEASRDLNEIKREVRLAVHRGAKEVMLLGQTVNSYGLDLNPRMSFARLLDEISQIEGLERIRFISPHPQEVREDFIELVGSNPKICRHIHMPLQSGSDRILKLMNRNYRRKRYLAIIEALKARVPDISITTDIIVGFPTETEAEFQESLEIMKLVDYDASFSFAFSPRPGTIAATMKDDVPHEVKLDRLYRLQALQDEMTARRLSSWIGRRAEVLFEGPSAQRADCLFGRSSQNFTVNLEQPVEWLKPGMVANVEITQTSKFTLKGRVVDPAMASDISYERSAELSA